MSRRFTLVTIALNSVVAFLVGATFAGGVTRRPTVHPVARVGGPLVDFADVVEPHSPAVGDLNTTRRLRDASRRGSPLRYDRDIPGRGAGSGFIIDAPTTSSPTSGLSTTRSASR